MAPKWADSAFDGEGARLYGGRWNSKGVRLVYTAGSLALACLELLVNIDYEGTFSDYVAIPVEFDESLVLRVAPESLPHDWQDPNALPRTRAIGDAWVARGSSAMLEVPSRVVPEETNYLLNPEHPDAGSVRIGQPRAFRLDPDLVKIPRDLLARLAPGVLEGLSPVAESRRRLPGRAASSARRRSRPCRGRSG